MNVDDFPAQVVANDSLDEDFDEKEIGYDNIISMCDDAMKLQSAIDDILVENIQTQSSDKSKSNITPQLITGEKNLLLLSSYPDCTEGILYTMPLLYKKNNRTVLFVRYFESGVFKGFFKNFADSLFVPLTESLDDEIDDICYMAIYSDWDVEACLNYRTSGSNGNQRIKNSTTFANLTKNNDNSLNKTLPLACSILKKKLLCPGFMVYTERNAQRSKMKGDHSKFFQLDGLGASEFWESKINSYMINRTLFVKSDLEKIHLLYKERDSLSLNEQCEVLSYLPNFHRWNSLKSHGVKMNEYFIKKGKSPRNRLINNFCCTCDSSEESQNERLMIIRCILKKVFISVNIPQIQRPLTKKKRISKKTKPKVTVHDLLDQFGISQEEYLDMKTEIKTKKSSVYEMFEKNLILHGSFHWRIKNDVVHKVVMNDFDPESGSFKFHDYILLQREETISGEPNWFCSCESYQILMSTVEMNFGSNNFEGLKCLHCHIFENIVDLEYCTNAAVYTDHHYGTSSTAEEDLPDKGFIKKGLNSLNHPVIELPCKDKDVRKFSVVASADVQFVHLFFEQKKSYVTCMSGLCQHSFGRKRTMESVFENKNLCPHLEVFRKFLADTGITFLSGNTGVDNPEGSVEGGGSDEEETMFNNDFDDYDDSSCEEGIDFEQDENTEIDEEISAGCDKENWEKVFDPHSGRWFFQSPFGHKVSSDRNDPNFTFNCHRRDKQAVKYVEENIPIEAFPHVEVNECACGVQWRIDETGVLIYEFDCDAILYTTTAPVLVKVHKLVCRMGICTVRWNGQMESIFRISSKICAGYEILWEFQDMVRRIKCNFSAYCTIITGRYKDRNPNSQPFMSPKTFRRLFFSWASHQLIEFREVCQWCGETPKVLAGDATRIGISLQKMKVVAMEATGNDEILPTPHRKFDRCFLPYPKNIKSKIEKQNIDAKIRDSRRHMKLIMSTANGFVEQPLLTKEQLTDRNKKLMEVFPEKCKPLLKRLFEHNLSSEQKVACSKFLYVLSFDAPLLALFPPKMLSEFREMIKKIEDGAVDACTNFLLVCEKVNPRIGSFVSAFHYGQTYDNDAFLFLRHIEEQITLIHGNDVAPLEPGNVREYNPPKNGHAYYFSASGNQIRLPRKFSIDGNKDKDGKKKKKKKQNHDDEPTTSNCKKKYPLVALKGTTFMFLWFCPQHGHCYGFHIVDGSEGRKDPCYSLFSYLKEAPQVVYYDFACGLEEFCLNREAGYFGKTKFYHDIFHGYTHGCSPAYSSKCLSGIRGINTSICEQFNAYLQCIKASAKHMSQVNFMFFAQYMIHLWNKSKKETFEKKLLFAASSI